MHVVSTFAQAHKIVWSNDNEPQQGASLISVMASVGCSPDHIQEVDALRLENSAALCKSTRVYVISAGPFCKVGISDDPLRRLHGLQTANPFRLSIEYQTVALIRPYAKALEGCILDSLAALRMNGEWLDCDPARVVREVRLYGGLSDLDFGDVL